MSTARFQKQLILHDEQLTVHEHQLKRFDDIDKLLRNINFDKAERVYVDNYQRECEMKFFYRAKFEEFFDMYEKNEDKHIKEQEALNQRIDSLIEQLDNVKERQSWRNSDFDKQFTQ
jgi:hypothetical protein